MLKKVLKHFHFCCGLGGGAKGFNRAKPVVGNMQAEWRCVNGLGRRLNWGEFVELAAEAEANDPSAFFLRQQDFPTPPPCGCYDGGPADASEQDTAP